MTFKLAAWIWYACAWINITLACALNRPMNLVFAGLGFFNFVLMLKAHTDTSDE